ncbi:MAG: PEP-CTERM sorting domain-containing protein [Planctomycetota bacterium]
MELRYTVSIQLGLTFAVSAIANAAPPSFTPLGDLPGGTFESWAGGVSSNGEIVAGTSCSNFVYGCVYEAFLWQGGLKTGLGFPSSTSPYEYSGIQAMSADGSILAGSGSSNEGTNEPFQWQNGVFTRLGRIPGYGTNAHLTTAMSDDGQRIVGWGASADGQHNQAWLWDNGSMMGLGFLPSSSNSSANGISGDGNVIVGGSDGQAFRWINGAMTGLGFLPVPFPGPDVSVESWAVSASSDGSVIVGSANAYDYNTEHSQQEAFRWSDGVMTGLGDLPGGDFSSYATAVSADGSVIVGYGSTSLGGAAFVWDSPNGMRDLRELLVNAFGLNLTGWALPNVRDISADGSVIVGTGINPDGNYEAFRVVLPEPSAVSFLVFGLVMVRRRKAASR